MSALAGVRVVEFEGLGPAPFCGVLLADLGADVIAIERAEGPGEAAPFRRGKRSIALDLKDAGDRDLARAVAAEADALIEGLRPGVMERLGLGPEEIRKDNPRIVYGRLTGWGQSGPLSARAGHDINYAAIAGAAWYSGEAGAAPTPPPTLVGDVAAGALYLTIGLLSGILRARETGAGTVVDAAIVDGAAHMMTLLHSLRALGDLPDERGRSMLDGAHFYANYRCGDDKWISVGALEPKFYRLLLAELGLADDEDFQNQFDRARWPALKQRLAALFASRPQAEWMRRFEATDACVAPVLSPGEAALHSHMAARAVYRTIDGVLQAAPAPRFGAGAPADPRPAPPRNADEAAIRDPATRWRDSR